MAVSAFQKVLNKLFQQFIKLNGRGPQTPKEYMDLQNEAVQYFNKTKGAPAQPKKPPFQGWKPEVIQGGKGIESLLKSGDVKKGVAPKTKLSTLEGKKQKLDTAISKEEWIAKKKAENKAAVKRFEEKTQKKTVEDFRDEGDWDPSGFAAGGIAKGAKWFINSLKKNLTDMEAGHPRFKVVPAKDQETLKVGYRTLIKDLEEGGEVPVEALEAISKNPQYYKTKKAVRSQDPDLAEVEELIDEKVFGDVRQELKDFEVVGRKPQASGGLAYMLGEPTYMKMSGGGNVGHGPWTTGQTPQGPQPQPEMPQPQVGGGGGQPNPMKAPRLPSVAPRNMDPQVMQQQRMQQAMGQQGIPQGIPRVGMMYGGDPGFAFEYGGSWADWHDQHRNAMPIEDYIQTKLPKERLPFREPMAGGGMTRRAFLKLMGALSTLPLVGKGIQKAAPKAIPKVTEAAEVITRGADGMPTYVTDLIQVVKAKGTKEIMEGIYKRNPPSTKYTYKDVEVVEDGLGNVSVKKPQTKTGSWTDEATDSTYVDDYVDREIGFEIKQGEIVKGKDGKPIKAGDEYNESTAHMQGDPDGGMDVSEVLEVIDDADHLDLKKIADEAKDLLKIKKASGGLAHLLGE